MHVIFLLFLQSSAMIMVSCGILTEKEAGHEKASVGEAGHADSDTRGDPENPDKSDETSETKPGDKSTESRNSDEFVSLDPETPEPEPVSVPYDSETCKSPDSALTSPDTMEQAVSLINSLPKPVTVLCFLQSLKKPLGIAATFSSSSAQPATDSPRFFIFQGDLIIAVTADGPGKDLVEFSSLVNSGESVKGELKFPVTETLAPDEAYAQILRSGSGTRCAQCHRSEREAPSFSPKAYISGAIRPKASETLSQQTLNTLSKVCEGKENERCRFYQNILAPGFRIISFPSDMPFSFP